jgi:hypothetical protein
VRLVLRRHEPGKKFKLFAIFNSESRIHLDADSKAADRARLAPCAATRWHEFCTTGYNGNFEDTAMTRYRISCWAVFSACMTLLGGCAAVGPAGLGEQAGTTDLPLGLALLDSTASDCDDSVHVGSSSVAGGRLGPQMFVEPGQNAAFRISETTVVWACTDDDSSDFHEISCSEGATHLRVTRAVDGGDLLFECFG